MYTDVYQCNTAILIYCEYKKYENLDNESRITIVFDLILKYLESILLNRIKGKTIIITRRNKYRYIRAVVRAKSDNATSTFLKLYGL